MKENVTILSIDDDPQICFALGELFKFQGWRAVSASDVASGLEAFRRYSPDIVLIDYHMPGVSGIEGVKLLRRQSSSVPIIVFTIDESQTVADTFLAAGASDFALKPIKAPDIVSRIRLHLRFAGQNRPEPALSKGISGGTLDVTNWRITTAAANAGAKPRHAGYHYEFPLRAERLCDRE
mgnify:CR=1 FL=1